MALDFRRSISGQGLGPAADNTRVFPAWCQATCPEPKPEAGSLSVVPEVISQRRRAVAGRLLVVLPVRAELVGLQRTNRKTDLPLFRRELDDLHLVAFADLQFDLLVVLAHVPRIIEFRHMDEPFDALVEFDERAEVGH